MSRFSQMNGLEAFVEGIGEPLCLGRAGLWQNGERMAGEQRGATPGEGGGFLGSTADAVSSGGRLRRLLQDYAIPIKFVLVGGLNTAFSYLAFATIFVVTGSDQAAVIVATIAGVLFNYFSTGRLVFSHMSLNRLPAFVLGYAVICTLNILALKGLAMLGVSPLVGQLIAAMPLAVLAFYVNSRLVFRGNP